MGKVTIETDSGYLHCHILENGTLVCPKPTVKTVSDRGNIAIPIVLAVLSVLFILAVCKSARYTFDYRDVE